MCMCVCVCVCVCTKNQVPREIHFLAATRWKKAKRVSGAWYVAWQQPPLETSFPASRLLARELWYSIPVPSDPITRSRTTNDHQSAYLKEFISPYKNRDPYQTIGKRARRRCPAQRRPVTEKNVEHPCRRNETHARPLRLGAPRSSASRPSASSLEKISRSSYSPLSFSLPPSLFPPPSRPLARSISFFSFPLLIFFSPPHSVRSVACSR